MGDDLQESLAHVMQGLQSVLGYGFTVEGMTEMMPVIDQSWVPDACTLPTVEQPLRAKEFDDLFRDAVTAVHRIDATRARLVLRAGTSVGRPGGRPGGAGDAVLFVLRVRPDRDRW